MLETIKQFIGITLLISGIFVMTFLLGSFMFCMKWADGVVLIFNHLGIDQPINNWVMWGIALIASMALCGLTVKVIEAMQSSLMNIIGCLIMFTIIIFPVYYSYMT